MKHLGFWPGTRSQINLNKFEITEIHPIVSDHHKMKSYTSSKNIKEENNL